MQLSKKLELYADKKIDFLSDVILQDDSNGKGAYIKEWNIDGIKKPDINKLQDYQESEYTGKFGIEKTDKERLIDLENEMKDIKAKK